MIIFKMWMNNNKKIQKLEIGNTIKEEMYDSMFEEENIHYFQNFDASEQVAYSRGFSEEKLVSCPDCHEWKPNYAAMYKCRREHRLSSGNTEAVEFNCTICSKTFSSRTSLTQHRHRRHGVNIKCFARKSLYQCEDCQTFFSTKSSLNRHVTAKTCTKSIVNIPNQ